LNRLTFIWIFSSLLLVLNIEAQPLNSRNKPCERLDSINKISQNYFDSHIESGKKICLSGIELARTCGDSLAMVQLTTCLGRLFTLSGEYSRGLQLLTKSEKLARKIGAVKEEARSLKNQGNVFYFINQFKEALPYYKEALTLSRSCNDSLNIAGTLHNIGLCFTKGYNEPDSGLNYLFQTLKICTALKDSSFILFTYSNIGGTYLEKRDYQMALDYLQKSVINDGKYLSTAAYSYILVQIGQIYYQWKDYKLAEKYAFKGFEIAESTQAFYSIQNATNLLANLYSIRGDYRKALFFSQKGLIINDSINKQELTEQIALMRIEHESQKRDQEIKLLMTQKVLAEQKLKSRKTLLNITLLILILIIIISVLGVKQYRIQKRFNKILKKQVDEKTHELAHALKRAEESDELKTKFLQNMSHEVRTPLNVIQGFSSLLAEEKDKLTDETFKDYTSTIVKNSNYLTELFDNITQISRLENDDYYIQVRDFKLIPLLKEVVEKFESKLIETRKDKVKIVLDRKGIDDNLTIYSDRESLYRILYNLLDNAVKFTFAGKIVLRVQQIDKEILFSVSDTGQGISSEFHNLVFEKFRKINLPNEKYSRGAGLGLPISKLIVEKMKGKIWFESHQGIGSNFYVQIPLRH
jgi:signal transduction histidine kinase